MIDASDSSSEKQACQHEATAQELERAARMHAEAIADLLLTASQHRTMAAQLRSQDRGAA